MGEPETSLKRVLHLKVRAMGDPAHVLTLIRSSGPFYRTMGGTNFRVLKNVDDPAQYLVEIEYEALGALEMNRQKLASDPMMRAFLQGWRTMLAGSADVDVYQDVTD